MVDIRGQFCIDRYENVFVDVSQRRRLSAFFSPTPSHTKGTFELWRAKWRSSGSTLARSTPIPEPPTWQLGEDFDVLALSLPGELPNAYVSGVLAARACENAGKRLCSSDEWAMACRGQAQRRFPYGDSYEHGRCNVHRSTHPARALHHDASRNHLDPRLNLVVAEDGPLLVPTGSRPSCASHWGEDAVYDMVGNLDEWVADPEGEFRGGFYARATKEGCEARITTHPLNYFDYSLGSRCCL